MILLVLFDLELSRKGFNCTLKKYSERFRGIILKKEIINEKEIKEIEDYLEVMDIVCAWYPRKADCIHKSFLGYRLIRKKYHLPVEIVIGVRKYPFAAHAWLQCNEVNFIDDKDETEGFKIIMGTGIIETGDTD